MKPTLSPASKGRLESLDILRGFDLFLLVFFQPVFTRLVRTIDADWLNPVLYQFDHEVWEGFRLWDLVMPLFLFMAGTSIPFAFAKYKNDSSKHRIYRKIARRFVVLYLLGMVVQGNLLGFNPDEIYLYTNTLQSIAVGYVIASLVYLHFRFRNQLMIALALLIAYSLPMMIVGDYSLEGNFAYRVDEILMGRFRGDLQYTWIWSSLTFGVTVLLGTFAGHIIRTGKDKPLLVTRILTATGCALIVLALVWSLDMPIIKKIWTGSMTLLAGGLSFLLMALFYYWIDVRHHHQGLRWLKIYGMNSITAYMLGEVVNFRCIATSLLYGFEAYLGDYYAVLITFANYLIVFLILRWMYRHEIFLRV